MESEKTIWGLITAVCIVALIVILAQEGYFDSEEKPMYSSADELHPLAEICLNHSGLVVHIHPFLSIEINGTNIGIPNSVGVDTATCSDEENMHVTHTHDSTGKIHVELNEEGDVPLAVLFDVWGKHFDSTGILDERVTDGYVLTMTVDGVVSTDFENHILEDGQNIIISFGPESQGA